MRTFKNLEEIQQYYNEATGSYEFAKNGRMLDINLAFDLVVNGDITAGSIEALNITCRNLTAWLINARDIVSLDLDAENITAGRINTRNIDACNIDAKDIKAMNITAWDITSGNIEASNIDASSIVAEDINFYAVCFAQKNINCKSIKGRHANARYFSLEGNVSIKED